MDKLEDKGTRMISDLEKIDCKTGHVLGQVGRIYGSWSGGRRRILGGERGTFCYHVMSRTCGGDYLFGHEEKEGFRKIMRKMARFSGVKVLTWCVMDNHFHILARVPDQDQFLTRFDDGSDEAPGAGEERLMQHLSILYTTSYIAKVRKELAWMREHHMEVDAEKFLDQYKRRFCDVVLFVKEVKERFSRWYNKKHDRRGTLWMDRFKSVLVEDGEALRTMSAYIDLNAVRVGMVEDPKDYRWCGYAEAVAGGKLARRGLCEVMGKPVKSWDENGRWYRCWLMADGQEVVGDEKNKAYHVKAKVGIPQEIVKEALEKSGQLTRGQQIRCRIRYLTYGAAFGSQKFIEALFKANREKFGPERKSGAKLLLKAGQQAKISGGFVHETSEPVGDGDESAVGNLYALRGVMGQKGSAGD